MTSQHKTGKIGRLPHSFQEHFQTYEVVVRLFQSSFYSFIHLLIDLEKDLVMPRGAAEVSGKSRLRSHRKHVATEREDGITSAILLSAKTECARTVSNNTMDDQLI